MMDDLETNNGRRRARRRDHGLSKSFAAFSGKRNDSYPDLPFHNLSHDSPSNTMMDDFETNNHGRRKSRREDRPFSKSFAAFSGKRNDSYPDLPFHGTTHSPQRHSSQPRNKKSHPSRRRSQDTDVSDYGNSRRRSSEKTHDSLDQNSSHSFNKLHSGRRRSSQMSEVTDYGCSPLDASNMSRDSLNYGSNHPLDTSHASRRSSHPLDTSYASRRSSHPLDTSNASRRRSQPLDTSNASRRSSQPLDTSYQSRRSSHQSHDSLDYDSNAFHGNLGDSSHGIRKPSTPVKKSHAPPDNDNRRHRRAERRRSKSVNALFRRLDSSDKASSPIERSVPTLSSCRKYLRHYIDSLHLPPGCLEGVMECYQFIDSRKWLIQNSTTMKTHDAHCMKIGPNLEYIQNNGEVSRWKEFKQLFDFHLKMSARCWIPTEFWLVNDPGPDLEQRFSVACGSKEDLREDREVANEMIASVRLSRKRNPLASQLLRIEKRIAKKAPELTSSNKYVIVMLCMDGYLSDEFGREGTKVKQDFVDSLVAISQLPVKLIVRLHTDNDKVTDFFNKLDSKLDDIDVLDDYFGEAMEVYLQNPWLTYSLGLHRLREAGLASDLIGELDERCFTIHDIHRFCEDFITGEGVNLPHPRDDWDGFISSLTSVLRNEKKQWNAIKKCQTPWIDIQMLEKMFGARKRTTSYSGAGAGRREFASSIRSTSAAEPNSNSTLTLEQVIQRWSHQPPDYKKLNSMQDLLVNMPDLFPPKNTAVEAHEYFGKWKCLSREAFTGEGEELNSLLKRAARRSKLFLHPDKLPRDLTENQTILFQRIWDIVQEQEMKTLS